MAEFSEVAEVNEGVENFLLRVDLTKYTVADFTRRSIQDTLSEYGCDFETVIELNETREYESETNFSTSTDVEIYPLDVYCDGVYYMTPTELNEGTSIGKADQLLRFLLSDKTPKWITNQLQTGDYIYSDSAYGGVWKVNNIDKSIGRAGVVYIDIFITPVETITTSVTGYLRACNALGLKPGGIREKNSGDNMNLYCAWYPEILFAVVPVETSGDVENTEITGGSMVNTSVDAGKRLLAAQKVFTWSLAGTRMNSIVPIKKFSYISTSYFILFNRNNDAIIAMYLPVFPQEFSDSNSSSFNPTSILGRSVQYQTYNTSSRTFSVSLNLHEELCDDYTYIHRLAAVLQSACYPNYSNRGSVDPIEILLVIGSQVKIRGILNSVQEQWSGPVIDDQLVHCSLSINITETTGPYSQTTIQGAGSRRGDNSLPSVSSTGYDMDVINAVTPGKDSLLPNKQVLLGV